MATVRFTGLDPAAQANFKTQEAYNAADPTHGGAYAKDPTTGTYQNTYRYDPSTGTYKPGGGGINEIPPVGGSPDPSKLTAFRQAADSARYYEDQTDANVLNDPRYAQFAQTGVYTPSNSPYPDNEIPGANFGQGRSAAPSSFAPGTPTPTAPPTTPNQFTDPYTSLYEDQAKQYLNMLTGQNAQFTQLMNYLNGQFQQKSQNPGYTPDELALLQTQALEPIEDLRQASKTRALQSASARGFLPTSGITGLQTGPDGQPESIDTAYDRMRAQAAQNIASQAIGLRRQDQNTALQLGQLGLQIPEQQQQDAVNVANGLYQLPHNALMDSLAVMNATNPAQAISPLVSLQALAQQQQNVNTANQAALWQQIGNLLAGLGL